MVVSLFAHRKFNLLCVNLGRVSVQQAYLSSNFTKLIENEIEMNVFVRSHVTGAKHLHDRWCCGGDKGIYKHTLFIQHLPEGKGLFIIVYYHRNNGRLSVHHHKSRFL